MMTKTYFISSARLPTLSLVTMPRKASAVRSRAIFHYTTFISLTNMAVTVSPQVHTPSLSEVRCFQEKVSSPDRLRLKMKAVQAPAFFQSANHQLHSFSSFQHRSGPPPAPSPVPSYAGGRSSPDGSLLSFSDFLNLAPDDLRANLQPSISSPGRLKSIVDAPQINSRKTVSEHHVAF